MTASQMRSNHRQSAAVLALRLAGASYAECADTLGMDSAESARAAAEGELERTAGLVAPEDREKHRAEEGARLDRLLRSVWVKATNTADPEHLPAVRTALALIDRRIRLFGADVPAELVVRTPTAAELDEWVGRMLELQSPAYVEPEVVVIPGEIVREEAG